MRGILKRMCIGVVFSPTLLEVALCGGNEHGNGGDVLVCPPRDYEAKQSVELLDLWEARTLRGLDPNMGDLPPDVMAVMALTELLPIDERRASILIQWAKAFISEANFLEHVDLPDINDSGDLILPRGCQVKQIAIQRNPRTSHDKRYLIDARLWSALDATNRAALIVHEVVYRDAIARGHLNSISTRYLTGLIVAKNLGTFLEDARELGFAEYRHVGATFTFIMYPYSQTNERRYQHLPKFDMRNPDYMREFKVTENNVAEYFKSIQRGYGLEGFKCTGQNGLEQSCYITKDHSIVTEGYPNGNVDWIGSILRVIRN